MAEYVKNKPFTKKKKNLSFCSLQEKLLSEDGRPYGNAEGHTAFPVEIKVTYT